jgi:hypothetical protein
MIGKRNWNMFFVLGILIGGVIAFSFLSNPDPIDPNLEIELSFGWSSMNKFSQNFLTLKGFIMKWPHWPGSRTSGHSISGMANFGHLLRLVVSSLAD